MGAANGGDYWNFNLLRDQADGAQRNIIQQDSYIEFQNRGHNGKAGLDYIP